MRAKFRFEVVKGKSTGWPRFENEREIMTTGIYRPVDDAVRIAVVEMVHWMHRDYGLSELDAYELFFEGGEAASDGNGGPELCDRCVGGKEVSAGEEIGAG